MAVGLILGGLLSGKWSDRIMQRESKKAAQYNEQGLHFYAPESRLAENVWLSIAILPGALMMYGWTIEYGLVWVVPVSRPRMCFCDSADGYIRRWLPGS